VSTETPSTLLWTRPSSQGWTEPCELVVCMLPAVPHRAAAQTRRRLRADHRAEPVACRCRCRHRRARSFAMQLCRSFVRRVSPSSGLPPAPTGSARHRRAKALPFFGLESCEHKPLSCACCRRCAIAMAVPPTFCPHTPSLGPGPIFLGRTCARALTRTEFVRRRMCLTSAVGPFLVVPLFLFPCLVHAISFVSPPWLCRQRSACTRTHTTGGPSPCFTCL
jgi:hypothetical protein